MKRTHNETPTVLPKQIDVDEFHRDTAVGQALADDKIERESALVFIKVLFAQVHDIIDNGLDRCRTLEGMLLGPFGARTQRVWIDGQMRIIHSENDTPSM